MAFSGMAARKSALVLSADLSFAASLTSVLGVLGFDCRTVHGPIATRGEGLAAPDGSVIFMHGDPAKSDLATVIRQLRETTAAPLVVIGPVVDPHAILGIMRAGAVDYVDQAGNLEKDIRQVLQGVTPKVGGTSRGMLATVTSSCGGTGCSVTAVNLAAALAERFGSCGLLDLDLHAGTLCAMLNLKPRHTIRDLCCKLDKLDRTMVEQSFVRHVSGIHLLAGTTSLHDVDRVTNGAIGQVVQHARTLFPVVVVDGLKTYRMTLIDELVKSDVVYLLTRLEFTSLVNTRRGLEHLTSQRIGAEVVRLIVSRHGQPHEVSPREACAALGKPFQCFLPDEGGTINAAITAGNPVVIDSPRAKVSQALNSLIELDELWAGGKRRRKAKHDRVFQSIFQRLGWPFRFGHDRPLPAVEGGTASAVGGGNGLVGGA